MADVLNYLYLDDNDKVTRDGDVEYINRLSGKITIKTDYPCSWAQRANEILGQLETIDGLILDWELTNHSEKAKDGSAQAEVDFSAESLAEHLRVNVAKSNLKDIPIILCSADNNKAFTKVRHKELSARNLFDLTFIKDDLFNKDVKNASEKLFDLAYVYKHLQSNKFDVFQLLNLSKQDIEFVDLRFVDFVETAIANQTIHDLIYFLLREFIEPEGLLINEQILAARLGIDIESSPDDWIALLKQMHEDHVDYTGMLSVGWQNFWAFKLEKWWLSKISKEDLRSMGAVKRVESINTVFKSNFKAAPKLKYCSSDEFWTICVSLNQPLDPSNGFIVGDNICSPWLDNQYVSGIGELEKIDTLSWRINVMDRERYNQFKAMVKNV